MRDRFGRTVELQQQQQETDGRVRGEGKQETKTGMRREERNESGGCHTACTLTFLPKQVFTQVFILLHVQCPLSAFLFPPFSISENSQQSIYSIIHFHQSTSHYYLSFTAFTDLHNQFTSPNFSTQIWSLFSKKYEISKFHHIPSIFVLTLSIPFPPCPSFSTISLSSQSSISQFQVFRPARFTSNQLGVSFDQLLLRTKWNYRNGKTGKKERTEQSERHEAWRVEE